MLCAIPFFAGDVGQAQRLLRWIADLGGCPGHHCLLVADAATPAPDVLVCRELAGEAFLSTDLITNEAAVAGWIPGSCSLFKTAALWAQDHGQSFLFLEPDAVPLKTGWLDTLAAFYEPLGRTHHFLGSLVYHQNPTWPNPYFEGVGIYPHDAWRRMESTFRPDLSWTQACASAVVPQAVNSNLFQHLWGEKDNPPLFAETNVPGTPVFCLKQIHPEAVIFHRNKDGSMIRLLRKQRGLSDPDQIVSLLVALPFCNVDVLGYTRTLDWSLELDPRYPYDCLLSIEEGTNPNGCRQMEERARRLFRSVSTWIYPRTPPRVWPPTWAFLQTALRIQIVHLGPWLWWEYDMIPLKPGWITRLDQEYRAAGRPFMGPIVPGQGHMNGTGIYPCDTPTRIPRALRDLGVAWDVAMKPEMIRDCHDCSRLLQHAWIMDQRGHFQATGGGPPPSFRHPHSLLQLLPDAVAFHRNKDGTLIQRLRERKPRCLPTSSLSPA